MAKTQCILMQAIADITSGSYGKIGDKYLSLRDFTVKYNVSYMTAVKIYAFFTENNILHLRNKAHYLMGCEPEQARDRPILIGVHVREVSNTFYAELLSALVKEAKKHGIKLIIMSSGNDANEKKVILREFVTLGCKGVINLNSINDEILSGFYALYPLPFIMFGAEAIHGIKTDYIMTDNHHSGRQAAKHLLACGAEKFYYVSIEGVTAQTDERQGGFQAQLKSAGNISYSIISFAADDSAAKNYSHVAADLYKSSRLSKLGIFCHHDLLAATILELCESKRIKLPDEICVIGYDDLLVSMRITSNLTSFGYSFKTIAEECLKAIAARIAAPDKPPSTIVIPTVLMVRKSTKNIGSQATLN